MDFSETLIDPDNIEYLCKNYTFFPITGLQVGRWLSAFHLENQLFLFQLNEETLVFLAVNSEGWQNGNSQYFLSYTRKELLKMFKNSPFSTPVNKKTSKQQKGTFLDRLGAQYGGVVAFEIPLSEIEGFDYSNTMNSYGSRLTLEVNKGKKVWFSSVVSFCNYYQVQHSELKSKYYSPCLSDDFKSFATKRLHPEYFGFKKKLFTVTETKDYLQVSTPDPKRFRSKVRRSLSVCTTLEESFNENDLYETDVFESKFNDFTIVAYFDDPIFPFFVKNLLSLPKNKFLLTKYERGIPSWAQFLPSYGLPYRPWMRKAMAVIIFFFSLFTMILGLYDLCNKVPQLKEVVSGAFGDFFHYFEVMVLFRVSMVFGYLYYLVCLVTNFVVDVLCLIPFVSSFLELFLGQLNNLVTLLTGICDSFDWISYIFIYFYRIFKSIFAFLYETLYFNELLILFYSGFLNVIYSLLKFTLFLLTEVKDFIILVFGVPLDLLYGLVSGIVSMVSQIFLDIYYFFYSIFSALRYILSIFKSNQAGTVIVESRGWWTIIKEFWDNIFRHIIKGITSIYHFVVYTTCNIYKHKDSMIVSFWIYYKRFVGLAKNKIKRYRSVILVYIFFILSYKLKSYTFIFEIYN